MHWISDWEERGQNGTIYERLPGVAISQSTGIFQAHKSYLPCLLPVLFALLIDRVDEQPYMEPEEEIMETSNNQATIPATAT